MGPSTISEQIYGWFMQTFCYYFAKKWLNYHWQCHKEYCKDGEEYWGSYIDWMISHHGYKDYISVEILEKMIIERKGNMLINEKSHHEIQHNADMRYEVNLLQEVVDRINSSR